jgi:hypothetical protein
MITSSNYYYTQMLSTSTSLSNQSGTSLGWRLGTLGIGSYLGETGSGEITFYISQRQNGSNVVSNGVGVQGAFHYEASNGFGYGYKMVGNLWNPNNTTPYDTVSIRFSSGYLEEGTILVWGRA